MSIINAEEVRHVASLARIAFVEDEIIKIAADLRVISDVVTKVSEVATPGVPATSHPIPLMNVWREDVVGPTLNHDETLTQAPHPEIGMFGVPQILGKERSYDQRVVSTKCHRVGRKTTRGGNH